MKRNKQDHIGIWFEQRRKLGVNDTILLAYHSPQTSQATEYIYQHGHMDGISCLIHCFDTLGKHYNEVPLSRDIKEPNKQQLNAIRKAKNPYSKNIVWRHWLAKPQQNQDHLYSALMTQEQTQAIQEKLKRENVSLNTLLFWALNKACADLLIEPGQRYSWLYPVSLRGAIDYGTPYSNYSSGFYLEMHGDTPLQELRKMICVHLKAGQHWISWTEAKIAKYLPGFIVRLVYRYISKRQFYAGSFSALGEWASHSNQGQAENEDDGWWTICAPGTANYPISNCSLIYNGKLSCTLKLHRNIVACPSQSKEVLTRWMGYLLHDTTQHGRHIKTIHSTTPV